MTADSLGEALAALTELRKADASGPLAGRVLEVVQDRRTRAELADRIAELDEDDWVSIDMDNLDDLFS